eukprot:15438892-Alexandrium_andersonii.AAC.1
MTATPKWAQIRSPQLPMGSAPDVVRAVPALAMEAAVLGAPSNKGPCNAGARAIGSVDAPIASGNSLCAAPSYTVRHRCRQRQASDEPNALGTRRSR